MASLISAVKKEDLFNKRKKVGVVRKNQKEETIEELIVRLTKIMNIKSKYKH